MKLASQFIHNMKHQTLMNFWASALLLCATCCLPPLLRAQVDLHLHTDDIRSEIKLTEPKLKIFEKFAAESGAPQVDLVLDQLENNAIVYHPVAAWNSAQQGKAQVSISIWVKNKESKSIDWQKVRFEYTQGGAAKSKEVVLTKDPFSPNAWAQWQNGRDYHKEGDVIYMDAPIAAQLTIKLYFKDFATPVVVTKALKAATQAFALPFRAYDLAPNEVWESASTHGGGSQVFAYDMGVEGYADGKWSALLPGKSGNANSDYRIWGKPIYAMADGAVVAFNNNVPNNPKPGEQAAWQSYEGGGAGNHFYIQHGDYIALYAHMQKGSLNDALLSKGKAVKKGDFLGYAGNAGSSSGPHLHVHVRKETKPEDGPFRPLIFNMGYTIEKTGLPNLSTNANWVELNQLAIPGFEGKRSFIWPGADKPQFGNTQTYTGVWRAGNDNHYLWSGVDKNNFESKNNTLKNQGLRLSDLDVSSVGNSIKYSGVWRAGTGKTFFQPGTTWAAFTAEWENLSKTGYRLIDIEVFTEGGQTKFAGVYGEGNDGYYLFAGMSQADFNAKWSELGGKGQRLIDMEVYKEGGAVKYAGVWRSGNDAYALWHYTSWKAFTDKWEEMNKEGKRLVDMSILVDGNTTYYSGVYRAGNDGYYLWQSNWNSFKSKWDDLSGKGFRLVDLNVR